MTLARLLAGATLATPLALAQPACAKPGDPILIAEDVTIDPIIDGRIRYEHVDQTVTDADAVTMRLRAGAEVKVHNFAVLAEAEGMLSIVNNYNAFPFPVSSNQRRTQYSTVADPENIELNRLQLQYKNDFATLTVGRQLINLDDQRWVGAGAWRQNEQTFDAVRAEIKAGPVSVDATYSNSQRTIYGVDAEGRQSYDGDFGFLDAGVMVGPVSAKVFGYLLDYDEAVVFGNSSVTWGVRMSTQVPMGSKLKLNLTGSYARQSDYGHNPVDYAADYLAFEGGLTLGGFTALAGWESLGSDASADGGLGRAVQTPLATLHKFNGWADQFLTTPNTGLQDLYVGATYKFTKVKALPGLNAAITWHRFRSDAGSLTYGHEWDGSLGFKLGQFAILGKYANYDARNFGTDTEKMWMQVDMNY